MEEEIKLNYFEELNKINVSDKIEKKNGLSYLSWAFAWSELKKRHPNAKKNIVKNQEGWLYHTDGRTCWVEVSVTINDIEEVEYLPVMDYKNQAIPLERVTSMNVNTTIQRAITKAIARHGLGLYVYAGEDLPDGEEGVKEIVKKNAFGLSPNTPLTDGSAMREELEAANKDTAKRLIAKINGMGSAAELEGWLEGKAVISAYNKLEKYAQSEWADVKKAEITKFEELDPND